MENFTDNQHKELPEDNWEDVRKLRKLNTFEFSDELISNVKMWVEEQKSLTGTPTGFQEIRMDTKALLAFAQSHQELCHEADQISSL